MGRIGRIPPILDVGRAAESSWRHYELNAAIMAVVAYYQSHRVEC